MYTKTQAQNIANEKRNHRYYRLYRWRVLEIMSKLARSANKGNSGLIYCAKSNTHIEEEILNQISIELQEVGYTCEVYRKVHKLYLNIKWGY